MTCMNVLCRCLSALVIVVTAASAGALEPAEPVVKSELQTVAATVMAIDPATREVMLGGPKGPVSFRVGPEARNLDKVHVGDSVVVNYYQGVAAEMSKGGVQATEPAVSTFAYPAQGGKRPGGGLGASITATVTIEDVDPGTNTVVFKGQDGEVHSIAVKSANMQQFIRTLKRGDSVDVTYTESIAVDVIAAKS
jgi:hypothetical protein